MDVGQDVVLVEQAKNVVVICTAVFLLLLAVFTLRTILSILSLSLT